MAQSASETIRQIVTVAAAHEWRIGRPPPWWWWPGRFLAGAAAAVSTPLVQLLVVFAPATLEAFSIVRHGVGWHLALTVPAALWTTLVIGNATTYLTALHHSRAIRSYVDDLRGCRFTLVPTDDYLGTASETVTRAHLPDTRGELRSYVHLAAEQPIDVRMVLVDADPDRATGPDHADVRLPRSNVAFYRGPDTVVFVKERPEALSGLQQFVLLHEIGHADVPGQTGALSIKLGWTLAAIAPVLIVRLPLTATGAALLVGLALTLVAVRWFVTRRSDRASALRDEAQADTFALRHLDPSTPWLHRYPLEKVARLLTHSGAMSDEERDLRERLLLTNLARVRDGLAPLDPDHAGVGYSVAGYALLSLGAAGLLALGAGVVQPEVTWWRVGLLGVYTLWLTGVAIALFDLKTKVDGRVPWRRSEPKPA